MKKYKVLKISILTLLLLLGLSVFLLGCMNFRKSTAKLDKEMSKENLNVEIKNDSYKNWKGRYLHYKIDESLPTMVFIHGAPGSATAFTEYIKDSALNQYYNIIVFDRIGYGYSSLGEYAGIIDQSGRIAKLLTEEVNNKLILVGHSFGGPIAAYTSMLLKNKVIGTIMIAPAIDPENEKYFPGGNLAYWKGTRWLFSKAWRVSAEEKYKHTKELVNLKDVWERIQTPILHIHGDKDKLVPHENLGFSQKVFNPKFLTTETWKGKGHLIPFTDQKACISDIKTFINGVKMD